MTTIIEVEHLAKRYGDTVAVADVSFTVEAGEIFGILGPNGAGKTTTVECLQGLREPSGGELRVLGLDPQRQATELRPQIGSQLQESALPDRLKVWEALDLFASLAAGGQDWRALMDEWGLTGKARSTFASLSGGQRQRLFVALALLNNPKVAFLDELTQGLDPAARRDVWELIRTVRERGTTVVLVTHYMDEAEQLCDRLAIVDGGEVIALGTPGDLIARSAKGVRVRFSTEASDVSWLREVDCVEAVTQRGRAVEVAGRGPVLALAAAALVGRGIVPDDLRADRATLEDVFLELTGRPAEGAAP